MKIAVPTRNGVVDSHFGHCEYYTVYTLDAEKTSCQQNVSTRPRDVGASLALPR